MKNILEKALYCIRFNKEEEKKDTYLGKIYVPKVHNYTEKEAWLKAVDYYKKNKKDITPEDFTTNKPYAKNYKNLKEIAEELQEESSLEYEDGNPYYYIHVNEDNFSFAGGSGKGIESFKAPYAGKIDDDFSFENLENKEFCETCEDLLEQVNAYIKDEMEFWRN